MGLLDRVKEREIFLPLDSGRMTDHLNRGSGLLERIPLFFSFIMNFWNLKKGVFLSLRGTDFFPVEITGFDTTSARKLRVSSSLLDEWNPGKLGKMIEKDSRFDDLFSLREASLIKKILIIPLYHGSQKPFGVLLLVPDEDDKRTYSEQSLPLCSDKGLMEKLDRALNPFSDVNSHKLLPMNEEDIKREILTEGDNYILIQISLSPLLEKIKEWHRLRDSFELKQELLSLFSSFFNERVHLYLKKNDLLIISYPEELFPGEKLLIRQIMNSLNDLYGRQMAEEFLAIKILRLSEQGKGTNFFSEA